MNDNKVQVNCKVHRSDYLEVGETTPYKGTVNANIQIVNTRTGECSGVVIDKEQAITVIAQLEYLFNI